MSIQTLERTQLLPQKPDEVFPFFEDPANLAGITPPWLAFRMLTSVPIAMKVGAVIDYTIRWLGIPVRWRTLITAYRPPAEFIDAQIKGPYLLWHHTHTFRAAEGGTEMTDVVRYALPFGILGDLVHAVVVRRQVEKIFDYRAEAISRVFEGCEARPAVQATEVAL